MEFLQVLEGIRVQDTSTQALFSANEADGTPVHSRIRRSPQYKMKLAEAARFVAGLLRGNIPPYRLKEVMSTSDFPIYFGDILDRTMLAHYDNWPSTWEGIAKRRVLNDFREAKVFLPATGADGVLDAVAEGAPYPDDSLAEQSPLTWSVKKYGRTVPFTWETLINDDLDQLKDVPERLGVAAKRTENDLVTRLYVASTGPHTSLYTSGNKNQIVTANGAGIDNPALSIAGVQDAFTVLGRMVDETGQPIRREMVTLVVPPDLEIVANNILNSIQIMATDPAAGGVPDDSSGSGYQRLVMNNWIRNRFNVVVDPYLPLVNTTCGHTAWYLFANPNNSRPALQIGFLRGHEAPEIWMKSPNAVRVGGGTVNPLDGDFDTDSVTYRVRHVVGQTRVDAKATVASKGTNAA